MRIKYSPVLFEKVKYAVLFLIVLYAVVSTWTLVNDMKNMMLSMRLAMRVMKVKENRARHVHNNVNGLARSVIDEEKRAVDEMEVAANGAESIASEEGERVLRPVVYKEFCVYPNITQQYVDTSGTIVMVLHSSADYFDGDILEMSDHWNAPMTLAIFASNGVNGTTSTTANIPNTYEKIKQLFKQRPNMKKLLSLTMFTNIEPMQECPTVTISEKEVSEDIEKLDKIQDFSHKYGRYPINVARNLARIHAPKSEYILLADVDQLYSKNAAEILYEYAKSRDIGPNKEVLVVRRYEFIPGTGFPENISEIIRRKERDVFRFHQKYFAQAHHIKDERGFLARGDDSRQVYIPLYGRDTHVNWEPMFVAAPDIPMHHEWVTYGANNQLMMGWHLCVLKYQFVVVDGVYNAHEGVRKAGETRRISWADQYRGGNQATIFKRKLVALDPEQARLCFYAKRMNTTTNTAV